MDAIDFEVVQLLELEQLSRAVRAALSALVVIKLVRFRTLAIVPARTVDGVAELGVVCVVNRLLFTP